MDDADRALAAHWTWLMSLAVRPEEMGTRYAFLDGFAAGLVAGRAELRDLLELARELIVEHHGSRVPLGALCPCCRLPDGTQTPERARIDAALVWAAAVEVVT